MLEAEETKKKIEELEEELWEATDVPEIEWQESACQTEEDLVGLLQRLEVALEESSKELQKEVARRQEAETEVKVDAGIALNS